ncbi:PhnD/SsuA/transferrin family substrate-binding protein [uncultured Hoeflea sp.]|mgnify:CR=1 FL=1|uniref:phosphate/phosphite/phosphonate ABC transporter substrate-binding protein n=1 Tax=uncultured Hoeflea sp. TaxID=538666 RepID=UPI0030EB62D4|tara:strand:+ start:3307 stop:4125 length:819 start_codon:yes stop_codon:yes gene_type:complete
MTGPPTLEGGDVTGAASLPMYDWPEIRDATDGLWQAVREQLRERGIEAPEALDRHADPETLWTNPALLLSQTCGYPYATMLADKVTLVGTPAHAVTGAEPGRYFSVLVARKNGAPQHLADLSGKRFAYNMQHSQSGFAAPVRLLADAGLASLPEPLKTAAHRASIQAVADGKADWAAIDAVTWELAKRHEPASQDLTVFARTPDTPALPLITSLQHANHRDTIADAYEAAITELDKQTRDAVLITGLARFKPGDYAPLAAPLPVSQVFPPLT